MGIPDINKYLFHFSIGHAERKLHRMEMKSRNFYFNRQLEEVYAFHGRTYEYFVRVNQHSKILSHVT